eukprot:1187999-Prorocentrum_minimum.AAC.3
MVFSPPSVDPKCFTDPIADGTKYWRWCSPACASYLCALRLSRRRPQTTIDTSILASLRDVRLSFVQHLCETFPDECVGVGVLSKLIDGNVAEDGTHPYIAGFVRLIFHDCVGVSCDGCVNLQYGPNAGLAPYVAALNQTYYERKYKIYKRMSQADLWALAGVVAAGRGAALGGEPLSTVFRYGRVDCSTSPDTNAEDVYPNANGGARETLDYWKDYFGFSYPETTALIGAHSLGRCHRRGSRGGLFNCIDALTTLDCHPSLPYHVHERLRLRRPVDDGQGQPGQQLLPRHRQSGAGLAPEEAGRLARAVDANVHRQRQHDAQLGFVIGSPLRAYALSLYAIGSPLR